ncbi:hypothetical protein [Fodinibius halophilus]|uniref:Uncharacterized protein n=1 Tax=Fodinibius halophilus TaxID=1736908 RepID=A0A6M1T6V2_9BACT|nr:hypothetical protein [Fodinibius halophilus]NGP89907.1 hypothetical protein [Fodinibius halophilus]
MAYVSPKDPGQFLETTCYRLDNGSTVINIVCIFAGNLVLNKRPYLKANNDPNTKQPLNPNLMEVLTNG